MEASSTTATNVAVLKKADLIQAVSRVTELPLKEAAKILELILESMVHRIECGDKVEIRAFGTFGTRPRGARVGRNPKTGARVEVPAKKIPFFKPSKQLRELLMKSLSDAPESEATRD